MVAPDSNPTPRCEPHRDPMAWDRLIAELGPASCIVVIDGWMGTKLKGLLSAEDIWQETLVSAWTSGAQHQWKDKRTYRNWMLSIAKNRIRDHARWLNREKRGGGRAPALFSEMGARNGLESGASLASLLPAGSTTPSRLAATNERAVAMRAALKGLDVDQALILRLHLFEEREMTEVATELGIGLGAAWYRFRQASVAYAQLLAGLDSHAPKPNAEGRP